VVRDLVLHVALIAGPGRGCVSVLCELSRLCRGKRFKAHASKRWLCCSAVRERIACAVRLRALQAPRVSARSGSSLVCRLRGKQFVPRAVWRGKLALMVRKQALLHQPPNPSIERTSSSRLRLLPAAAHVKR
jgi:hypothetical protein